jgi:hypothetical protein
MFSCLDLKWSEQPIPSRNVKITMIYLAVINILDTFINKILFFTSKNLHEALFRIYLLGF